MRCNELIIFAGTGDTIPKCKKCGTTYTRDMYPEKCVALLVDGKVVGFL